MDQGFLQLIVTPIAIAVSALAILAMRHKSWRGALAAIAGLLILAIILQIPTARDTQDMFILWRIMFFVFMGAITLMLMGISIVFGAMIGLGVSILDVALTRGKPALPIWMTGTLCVILGLCAGVALNDNPSQGPSDTACMQSHFAVTLAQSTLHLDPRYDLFFVTDGSTTVHRYSSALDAFTSVATVCRTFADTAPRVSEVSTGVFWREGADDDLPPGTSHIIKLIILDASLQDTSPDTRLQYRDSETARPRAGTRDNGYACFTRAGGTDCVFWRRVAPGLYMEAHTGITTTGHAAFLDQADRIFDWVQATWVQSPESP